jgi:hypothetical protein
MNRRFLALVGAFAAVAVAVPAVVFAVPGGKQQRTNPDAGLTDAQRDARYSAGRGEFEARYADWIKGLDVSKLDLASLPHADLNGYYLPPQPNLSAAAAAAGTIVSGVVTGIQPRTSGSTATLSVETAIKGAAADSIVISQAGGFQPTQDWKGAMIADAEAAPTLLPGDRVLLFVSTSAAGSDAYEVQGWTGTYRLANGRVTPLAGNPFKARWMQERG